MTIPTRLSGPTGIAVSAIGLGSWNTWNRAELDDVVDTLRLALDAGVTFFDVGIYGTDLDTPSENGTEMRFAAAFARLGVRRQDWVFAAKGWLPEPRRPEIAPLMGQLDALLTRQNTDHADFLVLGDLMVAPDDYTDILEQVAAVLTAGKARAWAVNNWAASEVAEIARQAVGMGVQAPDYAQHKYGLTRRSVPEGAPYRSLCDATGMKIQASDVFEGGLLFGARTTGTTRYIGGDIGGTQHAIMQNVDAIREAAASLGATAAQLSLAIPLLNPHTANVLIGSRTAAQTRDNLGVFDLLERHSAAEIRAAAEPFWFDRDVVSPDAAWGTTRDDDPASYFVLER